MDTNTADTVEIEMIPFADVAVLVTGPTRDEYKDYAPERTGGHGAGKDKVFAAKAAGLYKS